MGWFTRYRHSRGFGIHSPFAYRFITETLNEELPYYDYALLPDERQQLLYRIAVRLQPASVAATGGADLQAVTMACPHAQVTTADRAEMLIARDPADHELLSDALRRHATLILTGRYREALASICDVLRNLDYGMVFDNHRDMAIVVANPKLPHQVFEVGF